MYLVEVAPLKRGFQVDSLSYFSTEHFDFGQIITVLIREKPVRALVLRCVEASSAKTALRAATFSLKKLTPQENVSTLAPGLLKTAEALYKLYPYPVGTILFALLPSEIKRGEKTFPNVFLPRLMPPTNITPQIMAAKYSERVRNYKSLIRSNFAHGSSVLIVVPTFAIARSLAAAINTGIEDRVVTISGSGKPALRKFYKTYEDCSKAKVFIVTPNHAFLERHDITTIVVEEEHSQHLVGQTQPYLDFRIALVTYAKITNKDIILADTFVRTDEIARLRDEFYTVFDDEPKRLDLPATLTYVERPKREVVRQYDILTPAVVEEIDTVLAERQSIFLYTPRRGLAPIVVCSDCGHIFRDPDSGAPYTLTKTFENGEEKRWFASKTTGRRLPAADVCPACGSWKLREIGIGIQAVQQYVRDIFKDAKLFIFDKETVKSERRALEIMGGFYKSKGGILLGTSMALPYITDPVHTSVITSLDAVRATPTWRSHEELFGLLLKLREISSSQVLVQGKGPADDVFEMAKKGMLEKFYDEEIALRQILLYPPFTRFVHLTWRGKLPSGKAFGERIKQQLHTHNVTLYTDKNATGDKQLFYALIRVAESDWPNPELMDYLRNLPPSVRIMMNPDRII